MQRKAMEKHSTPVILCRLEPIKEYVHGQ